jgi:hypothetical protein
VVARPAFGSGGIWASTSQGVVPRRTDLHQNAISTDRLLRVWYLPFRHFLNQRNEASNEVVQESAAEPVVAFERSRW